MKAQRIKSSTRWTRGAGRKRSVAASLVVALSPGCVFGPMTEVRRTTIDESALLPVPVGPRALGSLPDKGVVVAELRANRTFAPAPMDAAALASTSQYYLENIAQFRLAKALGSRMELSLTADYGLPMRSPPTTPYQNLALQNSGSLWSTLSMRGLLGRNRQLCAVVGAETSAGTATYARRDHTEITTFSPTTHKPTIASLLFLEPQASSADPVLTVNETTRQGSDPGHSVDHLAWRTRRAHSQRGNGLHPVWPVSPSVPRPTGGRTDLLHRRLSGRASRAGAEFDLAHSLRAVGGRHHRAGWRGCRPFRSAPASNWRRQWRWRVVAGRGGGPAHADWGWQRRAPDSAAPAERAAGQGDQVPKSAAAGRQP